MDNTVHIKASLFKKHDQIAIQLVINLKIATKSKIKILFVFCLFCIVLSASCFLFEYLSLFCCDFVSFFQQASFGMYCTLYKLYTLYILYTYLFVSIKQALTARYSLFNACVSILVYTVNPWELRRRLAKPVIMHYKVY